MSLLKRSVVLQAEEQSLHATDEGGLPPSMPECSKKKKVPKGPNPLSVKKKKAVASGSTHVTASKESATAGVKRKRDTSDDEGSDGGKTTDVHKKRKRKRKHKS